MTTGAPQRRTLQAIIFCVLGTILSTAVDLESKNWAQAELSRAPDEPPHEVCEHNEDGYRHPQRERHGAVVLIDQYLEFRYAENCGAAFGMLADAPRWLRLGVFMTVGLLAIVALSFMFVTGTGGALFAWSVPLIVSGALGNVIDRIRFGYVVDFIRFHLPNSGIWAKIDFTVPLLDWHVRLGGWEYPTFNIADCTITVGVALLLLDALLYKGEESQKSPATPAAATPSAR